MTAKEGNATDIMMHIPRAGRILVSQNGTQPFGGAYSQPAPTGKSAQSAQGAGYHNQRNSATQVPMVSKGGCSHVKR